MEGIVLMEIKYKETGMEFECFHNRGASRTMVSKGYPRFQRSRTSSGSLR